MNKNYIAEFMKDNNIKEGQNFDVNGMSMRFEKNRLKRGKTICSSILVRLLSGEETLDKNRGDKNVSMDSF